MILADYCFAARFPKLPQPLIDELLPGGHGWRSDYGDPEKATDFAVLLAYSPIHNVRTPQQSPKQYPAMLLTTGDHDDRVVPLHSHKLLATLQHCAATDESDEQRNPLLSRIEVRAGHGAGKPTEKVIEEAADVYAFAAEVIGAPWSMQAHDSGEQPNLPDAGQRML